jgi:hypothetical protein
MSISNLKTSKIIPPPGVPKYPSNWINGPFIKQPPS